MIEEHKRKENKMNKSQVKNLEDLENYYSKVRKIRFREKELKFNSLEELFVRYVDATKNDTYFKRGSLHCDNFKGRSIDDFLVIAKNYFPDMTVKEILKELNTIFIKPVGEHTLYIGYCSTIRKNNIWKTRGTSTWYQKTLNDVRFNYNGFTNCELTIKEIVE